MAHVFISHSHRDADVAMEILSALEQRGVKCWTAPRDVPPGGSYAEAILTAIENASCFVLVYTENSNVSPHVLREVERALAYGANIIPVRFDGSSVSKSLDYLLATVHWLSVSEPRSKSIGEAAERIASWVVDRGDSAPTARTPPPPAMPASPPPLPVTTPQRGGRGLWLLWCGLVLLAIAGLVIAVQTVRHALPNETKTITTPAVTPTPQVAIAAPPPVASPPVIPVNPPPVSPPPVAATAEAVEETSVPTPEATPIAESTVPAWRPSTESPPSVAPVVSHEAPMAVVRRYFGYLADRNTIKAYELLSNDYRQRETFVVYTRNFASTEAIRLISAKETSHRARTAEVSVTFDKQNQRFGWIRWHGPVQMVMDAEGWRVDSMKALKPSSIRH